jgi:hypothetical protein
MPVKLIHPFNNHFSNYGAVISVDAEESVSLLRLRVIIFLDISKSGLVEFVPSFSAKLTAP